MRAAVAAAALVMLSLAACGGGGQAAGEERTLTVLAAASLTETFTELGQRFEEQHPGVEVEFSFGSSTTLAQQAVDGAPGDVLATADLAAMDVAAGVVEDRTDGFVTNQLVLVTPPDDPGGVGSLADLERPGTVWVRCVLTAPCGKVAEEVLTAAGISAEPASEEVDVKAVLARVLDGEADAGLVYATDAVAAGDDVRPVALPQAADHPTPYSIARLADSAEPDLAAEFLDLVLGDEGQQLLAGAGFGTAGAPG